MKAWKRFILYYIVSLMIFGGVFLAVVFRQNSAEHAVDQPRVYFEGVSETELQ